MRDAPLRDSVISYGSELRVQGNFCEQERRPTPGRPFQWLKSSAQSAELSRFLNHGQSQSFAQGLASAHLRCRLAVSFTRQRDAAILSRVCPDDEGVRDSETLSCP